MLLFIILFLDPSSGEQEASHVPTAERVYRIFHGGPDLSESPSGLAELLEFDFADLGKVMNELEAVGCSSTQATSSSKEVERQSAISMTEERFTGICIDAKPSLMHDSSLPADNIAAEHLDTHSSGGGIDGNDEVIVYVAPYPRKTEFISSHIGSSSAVPAAPVSSPYVAEAELVAAPTLQETLHGPPHATSFPRQLVPKSAPSPPPPSTFAPLPALISKEVTFLPPLGSHKPTYPVRWPGRTARRPTERHAMFSSFGAIQAEASLRELDPWWDEQRRGDSDVDWGDSMSEQSEQDEGMIIDQDLDIGAMKVFVRGMSAAGQTHISAGDIEDEARIRAEKVEESDEEGRAEGDGSEDEVAAELELTDDVFDLLAPAADGGSAPTTSSIEDEDDSTSDEEEISVRSFQARLERLRMRTAGRPIKDMLQEELDEELGVDESDHNTNNVEDIIANIQVTRSPYA
jgi:hypothetical protein